jgi:pyruvate dehydrogenase complex dehydrogenase (E1) component
MKHRPPLNLETIPDTELVEWLASLEYVIQHEGRDRAG